VKPGICCRHLDADTYPLPDVDWQFGILMTFGSYTGGPRPVLGTRAEDVNAGNVNGRRMPTGPRDRHCDLEVLLSFYQVTLELYC